MKKLVPPLLTMINELIATPSISSVNPAYDVSNMNVIELLADWLETAGFSVEILTIPNQKHKANLIATLGSGSGGLVLSGHTDTVPYDEGRWQYDPFKMTQDNNKLYGLGSADMKSFIALAIEAARGLTANDLKQPLIILATADEESSMSGARELVRLNRPNARFAVIGEPTNLKPIHAHKGIIMESITITGRSGHSSNPAYGFNAMETMMDVMQEIKKWRKELQAANIDERFLVPVPTLNFGHIHGGDNPNRICGECELQIDLRPLPEMSLEECRKELAARVSKVVDSRNFQINIKPLIHGTESMLTPKHSEIVIASEQLTGNCAETAAYCTEAPYFNSMGIDTIILGPGSIAQAHQPDEYIETASLKPTVSLLKNLIEKFCIHAQPLA
ncbi:Acetylornithine deacetylase [hydrothermal vent metagenome]|uniref:Acetylornithine deacetylase n=1 Tax=hydrothermal vent metagenome TaxID=652676 RepID=A0A3B1ACU0_9ZZZZ